MTVVFVRAMIVSVLLLLAVPGALLASPAKPVASPQATPQPAFASACAEYATFVKHRQEVMKQKMGADYPPYRDNEDLKTMTSAEARAAADRIDRYIALASEMPVPAIAVDFEREFNGLLALMADGYRAWADNDLPRMYGISAKAKTQQQRVLNETRALTDKCGASLSL